MTTLDRLPTPALLLDLEKLESNLDAMADRCRLLGVRLRPHIKTHKCVEVARLQAARGARGVTVSTLEEATAFIDAGFDDLTWAFPVVLNRLPEVRRLAERATLRLVVDSTTAVEALERLNTPLHLWLKTDCGYGRAGVDPAAADSVELARRIADSPQLTFDGILTHSGHAYSAPSRDAIRAVAEQERRVMERFAETLREAGIPVPGVSVGSTPAMALVDDLSGVTEARPGNYALFDYTQVALGSCAVEHCAATVLASIVSAAPERRSAISDAGALALSKDPGPPGQSTDGEIFADYASSALERDARLVALSQEHGKIGLGAAAPALRVGDRVRILPNHSCLTVACFDRFHVVRGDEIVGEWPIVRRRGPS